MFCYCILFLCFFFFGLLFNIAFVCFVSDVVLVLVPRCVCRPHIIEYNLDLTYYFHPGFCDHILEIFDECLSLGGCFDGG